MCRKLKGLGTSVYKMPNIIRRISIYVIYIYAKDKYLSTRHLLNKFIPVYIAHDA